MVYRQWQTLWETQSDERTGAWLARWAGLTAETLDEWELEPEYGAFVDQDGRIVSGARTREAWLDDADPLKLAWSSAVFQILQKNPSAVAVFLDWGTQSQPWKALFDAWELWESEGQILACGPVDVAFDLGQHWKAPAFVVFRSAIEHGLDVTNLKVPVKAVSLLERAQALRDASQAVDTSAPDESRSVPIVSEDLGLDSGEPLPMLPFTLASLNDEDHAWPVGTATFGA